MSAEASDPPAATMLGAAVVTYRGWPLVRRALNDLVAQTRRPDLIVVVDNGSDDGSAESIAEAYPDVVVVAEHPNRGYGAGLNAGLRALLARGVDRCLLLAQDCVLETDVVERLERALEEDAGLVAVGPLVSYRERPDVILSAGGLLRGTRLDTVHRLGGAPIGEAPTEGTLPSEWLDGSIMLLDAAAVRTLRFDERYYLYFEEVDFHCALRAAGGRIACVPGARAWQTPSGGNAYLETRNRLLFLEHRRSRIAAAQEIGRQLLLAGRDVMKGSVGRAYARGRLVGMSDYVRRNFGPRGA